MKSLILTVTALAVGASFALAEDTAATSGTAAPKAGGERKHRPDPAEVMQRLDTNGDKAISLDEFKAGPMGKKNPARAEEVFKRKDKDGNGSLSLEELSARGGKHAKGEGKKGDDKAPQ